MGYFLPGVRRKVIVKKVEQQKVLAQQNYSRGRKITDLFPDMAWKGQSCVIVAGGESVTNFDFRLLRNHRTIAVNRSFVLYDFDLVYSMDNTFYKRISTGELDFYSGENIRSLWVNSSSFKIFLAQEDFSGFGSEVYFVNRRQDDGISLRVSDGIYSANNSAFGALMLAVAMGADPIYLVGFDMNIKKKSHWHNGYPKQNIEDCKTRLESFLTSFETYGPKLLNLGINVINLNLDSAISCFPKAEAKKVL